MTAAVVDFIARRAAERRFAAGIKPLYRHHDFCAECLGHHALELSSDMARMVKSIAPQVENAWADRPPALLSGCKDLPATVIRKNTLILTGDALIGLGESMETAFQALMACADRVGGARGDEDIVLELRREAAHAGEIMSLLYQYHLEQIEANYADLAE
jgi:hypothetical protein